MGIPQYDMEAVQLLTCSGTLRVLLVLFNRVALRNISYRTFEVSGNQGPYRVSLYMGGLDGVQAGGSAAIRIGVKCAVRVCSLEQNIDQSSKTVIDRC